MQPPSDVIRGAIKIDNLPDLACKKILNFADAIKALAQFTSIEIPEGITNVIIGFQEPSTDDTNKLWVRRDINGNFVGLYIFASGSWRPIYNLVPGEVIWLAIDSRYPPEGFQLIDASGPSFILSSVRTALVADYLKDDPAHTYYQYAAYAFIGY